MPSPGIDALRDLVRAASVTAVSAFGLMLVAYCVLWRRRPSSPQHL
jgi:phage shock protein PspC (stress-responsive transcriptional regulator)